MWKSVLEEHFQYLEGIAGVGLLPSHYPCTNLSGVANPEFVPLLGQHLLEPLRVPGGFHPHSNWGGKSCIKSPGFTILVLQPSFDDLPARRFHHCNLLKARVKITSDNEHRSAPSLRALVDHPLPSLLGRHEPTTSSNHSLVVVQKLGLVRRGMKITTLPLSQIHPSWRGSLIPSAFDALTRGMERERNRLSGLSFLTLTFRQEYDYDGLMEDLQLLKGFSDEATAIHYVEQLTEQALSASLAAPGYGNYRWRHDPSRDNEHFKAKHESSLVRCVHLRSFKILNDSGYDSKYFQFEVVCVNHPSVFGPDLLTYYDAESEWVAYFISKGEE